MSNESIQIRWLDDVERKIIDILFRNPPSPRLHDRASALRMASQGFKTTQIVQSVNRNRSTIQRWIRDFNRRGTASLACTGAIR